MRVQEAASLKSLNSFGVESRARRLVVLGEAAELDDALAALAGETRVLVLGGGSNLLLAGDFEGTVLQVALQGKRIVDEDDASVLVEAAAGENWHGFVDWTLSQGLSGLENLSLIPGTVGASPIQNIGAYGVEICERFESLEAVDRDSGERRRFGLADCRFGYRDSVFKRAEGARWLILSVRYRLSRHFEPRLAYLGLREELGEPVRDARAVAQAVIAIRQRKLPDPARLGNAGSFFRNPLVERSHADALAAANPGLPRYPASAADGAPDKVKLSAAWLIERCGWKGFREGDAGVHERHALVLVNHGKASGAELLSLAERIRDSVAARFGVELEAEPTIIR